MESPSYTINPGNAANKTVVIAGAFRGGTTMVSAAVHCLGIPMRLQPSTSEDYDNWEDPEMQAMLLNEPHIRLLSPDLYPAIEMRNAAKALMDARMPNLVKLVRKRNEMGSWGWKFPLTTPWLLDSRLLSELENPHIIIVFRDPFSVWQHECKTGWTLPENFQKPNKDTGKTSFVYECMQLQLLQQFVLSAKVPLMAVSFERARKDQQSKLLLLSELCRFLHIAPDEKKSAFALEHMKPQLK